MWGRRLSCITKIEYLNGCRRVEKVERNKVDLLIFRLVCKKTDRRYISEVLNRKTPITSKKNQLSFVTNKMKISVLKTLN